MEPILYTVFIDELLWLLKHPAVGFADDLKFIVDVTEEPAVAIHSDIDAVTLWTNAHCTPLSIEKCGVLHCSNKQPRHAYVVYGKLLKSLDRFADLGVLRRTLGYDGHFQNIITKVSRSAGIIRRCFKVKDMKLMRRAFQYNVMPIIMYCSQVYSPHLHKDIDAIKRIQWRFTKYIKELENIPYFERLRRFNVLTLRKRRIYAGMLFVFKCLHNLTGCTLSDVGLSITKFNTRGNDIRLEQRMKSGTWFSQSSINMEPNFLC